MLTGKTAIITGAGQGIGKEIALTLAKAGAQIVVCDISEQSARDVSDEIKSLDVDSLAVAADVSKMDQVKKIVEEAVKKFGQIDILVNNAGITRDTFLIKMKPEDWDAVIQVNLTGVFNCTQAVTKKMLKKRQGKIINITSIVGAMGNAGQVNYAASKAGVIGFTKSVARELASRNINVNAVAPGFIDTKMTTVLSDSVKERLLNEIPFKRFGLPEDVAKCVKFLASEDSAYITGQVLHVNGGMLM